MQEAALATATATADALRAQGFASGPARVRLLVSGGHVVLVHSDGVGH